MTIFVLASILLAGCARQTPVATVEAPAELEAVAVSRWTGKTELFMEYQPLVAGAARRFAVHLTDLNTFHPVVQGTVSVRLAREGAEPEVFSTTAPSRPGIFGLDVQPRQAGQYEMTVSLASPGLDDTHLLGPVVVYASDKEIPAVAETQAEERISFLKEQQWALDFGTALTAERAMRESLRVTGEVRPRSGGDVQVTAPISGRIAESSPLPVIGTAVSSGAEVASLVPFTPAPADRPALEFDVSEATTALDLARRDRERTERLLSTGAIPAKRLEEARAAEATAAARLVSARERLAMFESSRQADSAGPRFLLRAPMSGVVAEVKTSPGSNISQGDPVLRIVSVDTVYVLANVPESEVHRLGQLTGAEIELPGSGARVPVGRLVSRSSFVDPASRTLGVIYEVPNTGRRFAVGQSVLVRLFLSGSIKAVTVPEAALVDDGGRTVVFIQHEGESFSRRPVSFGVRESGLVQVTEGLKPGERVVTRGAYLIRLAAMSAQIPAHGHVH